MTTKIWPDRFKLDGKIVVVTGAGLIGSIIIKGLAEAGAKVIMADINDKIGKKLEKTYKIDKLDVIFKKLDFTNEEEVSFLLNECMEKYGKIDGLVNTAYPRTEDWGTQESLTNYDSWKKNVEMHLGAYYITSIKVAELMKKKNQGSIVNFSSTYGVVAPDFAIYEGIEYLSPIAYSAIKGAVNMLTKYIATLYGKYNIRANVIAPGGVFNHQPESLVKGYNKRVPLERMASPEDIAGPVLFLISDAASYITGQVIMVDGGWTTW